MIINTISSFLGLGTIQGPSVTGEVIGTIVGSIVVIATGLRFLKKRISEDAVSINANQAHVEIIRMLRKQIELETARANRAESERVRAYSQINDLRDQIMKLEHVVRKLQSKLSEVEGYDDE